jgi:hypothetical protein
MQRRRAVLSRKTKGRDYAIHRGRLGNATVRIYDQHGALGREIAPRADAQMLYYPIKR